MGGSRIALLLVAAGCRQVLGLDDPTRAPGDGRAPDGRIDGRQPDGPPDAPSGCLGTGVWTVCVGNPMSTVTLPSTVDTDLSPLCAASVPSGWLANGQPNTCFIIARSITGSISTIVTGTRPLVLAVSQNITLDATLDVASHRSGTRGASANYGGCAVSGAGIASTAGAGGGAGGSFGSTGGNGGKGNNGATAEGIAGTTIAATTLHGGCRGGDGGKGNSTVPAGADGGGAVYLVAGGSITVSGVIDASGAGAAAAPKAFSGGAGGGSGGMIVLDAASIMFSGSLFANGGGGGGGADVSNPGAAGSDPTMALVPAPGGNSAGIGGSGGSGAYSTFSGFAGGVGNIDGGGGGGGGGVGVIQVLSGQTLSGNVSPPPS